MFEPRKRGAARAHVIPTSEVDPRLSDVSSQFTQWSFEGGMDLYTKYYKARFALNMNPLLDLHLTFGLGRGAHGIVSSTKIQDFINHTPVPEGYSDTSYVLPTSVDNLLVPLNYVSAPSPAGSSTSSGSLSGRETFERHPCLGHEIWSSNDIHRPGSRGKRSSSMYSAGTDLGHNTVSPYTAEAAFHPMAEWPVPQLQPDTHWGTAPSYLPYISQKNQGGVPQISPYPQYDVVQRLPTGEEPENWSQVFNSLKGITVAKKPTPLACYFCRKRSQDRRGSGGSDLQSMRASKKSLRLPSRVPSRAACSSAPLRQADCPTSNSASAGGGGETIADVLFILHNTHTYLPLWLVPLIACLYMCLVRRNIPKAALFGFLCSEAAQEGKCNGRSLFAVARDGPQPQMQGAHHFMRCTEPPVLRVEQPVYTVRIRCVELECVDRNNNYDMQSVHGDTRLSYGRSHYRDFAGFIMPYGTLHKSTSQSSPLASITVSIEINSFSGEIRSGELENQPSYSAFAADGDGSFEIVSETCRISENTRQTAGLGRHLPLVNDKWRAEDFPN
ncbi:hypothetical protein B0H16DRAFT_1697279 [Mycena metata]|uniref:Uncharacterized protein n=1 Tax=Mycena metata TaxID=1033252 RepID=A0AAD7HX03_9AGAR|nr:hypothetical protein B0H16DRAFT_1697279 [Mycena metata]